MEKNQVAIGCECGKLRGTRADARTIYGQHFVCMCDDCQAWAHHLGQTARILDANGGTDVVPTMPADLKLNEGLEHLRCVRFTENGLYRWYASCCQAPIANSLSGAAGYIGLLTKSIQAPNLPGVLGPARGFMMAKWGIPPLPAKAHQKMPLSFLLTAIKGITTMLVTGRRKPSPFFDSKGQPVVQPRVLSATEWAQLKARVDAWREAERTK